MNGFNSSRRGRFSDRHRNQSPGGCSGTRLAFVVLTAAAIIGVSIGVVTAVAWFASSPINLGGL